MEQKKYYLLCCYYCEYMSVYTNIRHDMYREHYHDNYSIDMHYHVVLECCHTGIHRINLSNTKQLLGEFECAGV